ncbi:hypothetical protein SLE2022_136920 [Rubroshorea leprosula]
MAAVQSHLLINISTFLITFFFIFSCSNTLEEDPLHNIFIPEVGGYDPSTYPSYFTSIDNGRFQDLIKLQLDLQAALSSSVITVSVDDFGAKADGTDDTQAFVKAWKAACSAKLGAMFVVPKGKSYHLTPIKFSGPCESNLIMQIYGTLEASNDRSDYKDGRYWIEFDGVHNLSVQGGGIINGNGKIWWQNSCKIDKTLPCKDAPTAVTFSKCKNLIVRNLKIQDAQQIHLSFSDSSNVQASGLTVTAPETSPNTDGIHVTNTQNIQITSSVIGTGDDCISIVSGSQNVLATDITCGPGHGISIGSLGSGNSEAYVSGVTVNGARLSGTKNGVRIKTWQGGSGSAINIKFQNIEMNNVINPIIIDQNYCDQNEPCKQQSSAVQVKNVVYKNIKGISASNAAIKFDCSQNHPCQGILLQDVDLQLSGDKTTKAVCNNVEYTDIGNVSPHCT